jgi:hypothetical protein
VAQGASNPCIPLHPNRKKRNPAQLTHAISSNRQ